MILEDIVSIVVLFISYITSTISDVFNRTNEENTSLTCRDAKENDRLFGHRTHGRGERVTEAFHLLQAFPRTVNQYTYQIQISYDEEPSPQFNQNNHGKFGLSSKESQGSGKSKEEMIHLENKQVAERYHEHTSSNNVSPAFRQSFKKSLEASFAIIVAVIPLGLFAIFMLYFDLNTSNLCFEWNHHFSNLPFKILGWKLFGEVVQAILLNLEFPVLIMLSLGWHEYRSNYISTFYIGLAVGATTSIYKTFLFVFGVFRTKLFYRYPGNVLFAVGGFCSCILVAQKIQSRRPSVSCSRLKVVLIISNSFLTGCLCSMIYRYILVPIFNATKNDLTKTILAAVTPLVALLPTAISTYIILKHSSKIIKQDRSFVLAYFTQGMSIVLYRVMQADVKSSWLFIAFSVLHGFLNLIGNATKKYRVKMWTNFMKCLKNTFCCRMLEPTPYDTPHQRQLSADLEIQNMLFQYTSLVLSQAYAGFYLTSSFNISHWAVLKESFVRVSIGLGIDFIFNCFSIFVQIHWQDISIPEVFFKHWKRHMLANAMVAILVTCYFTPVLLSIYQVRMNLPEDYILRNCTLPFTE